MVRNFFEYFSEVFIPTPNINILESVESTTNLDDDLKIMTIPKMLHEHFECVVGKNVFIDKPWTQISHKKILDHLQKEKSDSCFWKFRKELEVIRNYHYFLFSY
jgi:hypothetical protein